MGDRGIQIGGQWALLIRGLLFVDERRDAVVHGRLIDLVLRRFAAAGSGPPVGLLLADLSP